MVHLPLLFIVSAVRIWLFFVQHQFEDTYWAGGEEWDYATAALQGKYATDPNYATKLNNFIEAWQLYLHD